MKIPRLDRSSLDEMRFYAKVVKVHTERVIMYIILFKWGTLDRRMITLEMNQIPEEMVPSLEKYFEDALVNEKITMHAIGTFNSSCRLKPVYCSCKSGCRTQHCSCRKNNLKCTRYCDHECTNMGTILEGTETGLAAHAV